MSHNAQAETEGDRCLAFSICTKFCLQILSLSLVCLLALGPREVDSLSQETMVCFHEINH